MPMSVKIGHAVSDERGRASGGQAGDQNGKEVCTRNWYNKPWTAVIRPLDPDVAEHMALAMEQACANHHIGYDQKQRTTLYFQARNANWDLSKITTNCECDCSSLVAVCVNAAGIEVSKDMYTGNELSLLNLTGRFEVLTDKQYLVNDEYLRRGDILLGSGHTAIVLSNGIQEGNVCLIELRELEKGCKGDDVRALQILLSGNGYDPNGIDGSLGSGCQKAVKQYQKDMGLTADGIVGKNTWNKLLK